jgi:hypothetical protein
VAAAVMQRNQLVQTLKGLLEALGLERRPKPVQSLREYMADLEAAKKAETIELPASSDAGDEETARNEEADPCT